jgi:hypothetical protein
MKRVRRFTLKGHAKAYFNQIRAFYHLMIPEIYAKSRNLEGSLSEFRMRPGLFWEMCMVAGWFLSALFRLLLLFLQLVVAVVAFVLANLLLLASPVIILLVWPVSAYKMWRKIKIAGENL